MSISKKQPHPEALYYHTAADALSIAKRGVVDALMQNKGKAVIKDAAKTGMQSIVTCMVFSSLCLESYINQEYCAHKKTKQILEKPKRLSLRDKWIQLPKYLGFNTTFNKTSEPWITFDDLVNTRNNRLVHFKPYKEIQVAGDELYYFEYFGDIVNNLRLSEKYLHCVDAMIRELNRLTNGKTEIPPFLDGKKYISSITASMTFTIGDGN